VFAAAIAVLLLHLAILCPGPGLLLLRRLDLVPLERLCVAIALSLGLAGTGAFAIRALALPSEAHVAWSAALLLLSAAALSDLRRLARRRRVRRALAGYALLLGWSIGWLGVARHYSGGPWYGDWAEHYQRALFFLGALPPDFAFLDRYALPTRPPLMNALVAHLLWPTGARFELFQVAAAALGATAFLPCVLLMHRLARAPARASLVLAALLALSPAFMQNVTYPWTKLFAAAFVVLGIAVYLRALRRPGAARLAIVFGSLATGCMIHWSAIPYAVAIATHALWTAWRRGDGSLLGCLATGVASLAIAAPWFAWATATYGAAGAFGSTPTALDARSRDDFEIAEAALANAWSTLVPHWLRVPLYDWELSARWVAVRDAAFLTYQTNLVFLMGSVGGVAAIALGAAALRRPAARPGERAFWILLLATTTAIGVSVVVAREPYGAAQLCLLPLGLVGVAWLTAHVPGLPGWARAVLLAGAALDFALGVALHFAVQHEIEAAALSRGAAANRALAERLGLGFLGDHTSAFAAALLALGCTIAAALLAILWRAGRRAM
jgi:hypothetical protein